MPASRQRHLYVRVFVLALCEAVCIFAAAELARQIAVWWEAPYGQAEVAANSWALLMLMVWFLMAIDRKLYTSRRSDALVPQLVDVAQAMSGATLMTLFSMAILRPDGVSRSFALTFCGLAFFFLLLFRLGVRLSVWGIRGKGFHECHIVLIGCNARSRKLVDVLRSNEQYGFVIDGYFDDDASRGSHLENTGVPYLGDIPSLEAYLTNGVVDVVYVTVPMRSHYGIVQDITYLCEGIGVRVRLIGDFFLSENARAEIKRLEDLSFLSFSSRYSATPLSLDRLSDWVMHAVVLFFLLPVFAALAFAIWLESGGPVFVPIRKQDPQTGREFMTARFRTRMAKGEAPAQLTAVGAFLERYSLHLIPEILCRVFPQATTPAPDVQPSEPVSAAGGTSRVPWATVLTDLLAIGAAFVWAAYDSLPWNISPAQYFFSLTPFLAVACVLWFSAASDRRLLQGWKPVELQDYLSAIIKANGISLILGTVIVAIALKGRIGNEFLLPFCVSMPVLLLAGRLVLRVTAQSLQRKGVNVAPVLIAGANERSLHLAEILQSGRHTEYRMIGFLEDDPERAETMTGAGIPYLGNLAQLESILDANHIETVFAALPVRSSYAEIQDMLLLCERRGVTMKIMTDLFQARIANKRAMYVDDIPVVSLSAISENYVGLILKRLMDILFSTLLLIPLAPIFAFTGILIKLDSKGPVFFLQERIGQNQRKFKMIKFRTMVANAEELKKKLEALNEASGPVFKIKKDPRLTRIGGFMRKHSLDEFPQLLNVLKGEMSLVGPRPPIQSEVVQYTWPQRRRLSVRPGMTGLWQVSGRSNLGFDEWVELDLKYIDNWNLWLDFTILLKTYKEVIFGRGAA